MPCIGNQGLQRVSKPGAPQEHPGHANCPSLQASPGRQRLWERLLEKYPMASVLPMGGLQLMAGTSWPAQQQLHGITRWD